MVTCIPNLAFLKLLVFSFIDDPALVTAAAAAPAVTFFFKNREICVYIGNIIKMMIIFLIFITMLEIMAFHDTNSVRYVIYQLMSILAWKTLEIILFFMN